MVLCHNETRSVGPLLTFGGPLPWFSATVEDALINCPASDIPVATGWREEAHGKAT